VRRPKGQQGEKR